MKKMIFFISLALLVVSHTRAQGFFRDRMHQRPKVNPLLAGGITSMSLGVCGLAFGTLLYATNSGGRGSNGGKSSYSQEQHDASIALMGIGGGLVVVGGVLLTVAGAQNHKKRWGLIAPKVNEFGFAYNF
jgi:hypothetical protein